MSDRRPMEQIDLRQAEDLRDVVHRAVAALAQGESLLLRSERFCGYLRPLWLNTAVHSAERPAAKTSNPSEWVILVRGIADLEDWVPRLSPFAARVVSRAWPSPLTLHFAVPEANSLFGQLLSPTQEMLKSEAGLAFQCPEHPFVREVLRLLPGPLGYLPHSSEVNSDSGSSDLASIDDVSLTIDDFQTPLQVQPATRARMEDDHWVILQEGLVTEALLTRLSGLVILFVCTGNTCRSPLAEALCKILIAKRQNCSIDELEQRGFVVISAGIAASSGMPAAQNAILVAESRGGSLRGHTSQPINRRIVDLADHILVMTDDHLEALSAHVPTASQRTRLLHPEGRDVPDPVGQNLNVYHKTANAIETYLERWLDENGI